MPRIAANQKQALTRARRDQIVDAAIARWLEDGYDATTVSAIAREAGLAKGTVYLYFRTKQDILDEVLGRYSLVPDLTAAVEAVGDVAIHDVIPLIVRALWMGLCARGPIIQLLVRELAVRPERARRFVDTVVLPANTQMASYLRSRASRDELRDVDWFVASRALVGMLVVFMFTQKLFGGDELRPIDDELVIATVSDVFLNGITGRAGG